MQARDDQDDLASSMDRKKLELAARLMQRHVSERELGMTFWLVCQSPPTIGATTEPGPQLQRTSTATSSAETKGTATKMAASR